MNKFIIHIILLTILFTGCKKESDPIVSQIDYIQALKDTLTSLGNRSDGELLTPLHFFC